MKEIKDEAYKIDSINNFIIKNDIWRDNAMKSYVSAVIDDVSELWENKKLIELSDIISNEINNNNIAVNKVLESFDSVYLKEVFIWELSSYKFLSSDNVWYIERFLSSDEELELEINTWIVMINSLIDILELPSWNDMKVLDLYINNTDDNFVEKLMNFLTLLDDYNNKEWNLSDNLSISLLS